MRIVFLVHRFWPSVGGVEKYIHELAAALQQLGHHVQVVAGDYGGASDSTQPSTAWSADLDATTTEFVNGIPIHRFPAQRSPIRCRWWFWQHRHLFHDANVIHISNTHMLEYWRRITSGLRIDPAKVFLTRHGMSCRWPVPESERIRAQRTLPWVQGVVHDGNYIEKWLGISPHACPDQGLNPLADAIPLAPLADPHSAIFVGRLEPDSGVTIYLDALRHLVHDYHLPIRLSLYGAGSLRAAIETRIHLEQLPVTFHDKTPNAQQFMSSFALAFLDGRMAIQEAMARRVPVFAGYPTPLKRDYVCGESFSPYLTACGSGEELAEHAKRLLINSSVRQDRVEAAFQYSRSLSWDRTANAYLELWSTAIHTQLLVSRRP